MNHVTILNGVDVHSAVFEFTVRYIKDTNTLRISRPAMNKWLTEQRLSPGCDPEEREGPLRRQGY